MSAARGGSASGGPQGAVGAARLLSVIPVPAKITAKSERSWTWRVGPVELVHRVVPAPGGSLVTIDLRAPGRSRARSRPRTGR